MKNFKRGLAFALTLAVVLMSSGLIFVSAAPIGVVPASSVVEIVRPFSGRVTEGVGFSIAVAVTGTPTGNVEILNFGEPFGVATVNSDMWIGGDIQPGNNRPRPTVPGGGFYVLTVADPMPGIHYFTARVNIGGTIHESEAVAVNVLPAATPTSIFNHDFAGYNVTQGTVSPPANWTTPTYSVGNIYSVPTPGGPVGDISMRIDRITPATGMQAWWLNSQTGSWGTMDGIVTIEMSFMAAQTNATASLARLGIFAPAGGSNHAFWTLLNVRNDGQIAVNLSQYQGDSIAIRPYTANTWYHVRYEMNFNEGSRTMCVWVAEGSGPFVHHINQVDISDRALAQNQNLFSFAQTGGWRIDTIETGTWYISNFSASRPAQDFALVDATLPNGDLALADVPTDVGTLTLNFNQGLTTTGRTPVRLYRLQDDGAVNVPVTSAAGTATQTVVTVPALRPGMTYELVVAAGTTSQGGGVLTEQTYRFMTARTPFWVEGADFAAGSGTVEFINDTGSVENVVVLLTLQRDGATVENGISVIPVAVPTGSHTQAFNLAGLPATQAGDVLHVFVWRSLVNPRPLFGGANFTI